MTGPRNTDVEPRSTQESERDLLLEIEKTMRYLVRSRSFSSLNETEFRTVRSMLDRLDEARRRKTS